MPGPAQRRWHGQRALAVVCATVALAVVAPLLSPGTVLVQDMVFVPRQPWRLEWLGLAESLPRSVPVDAVVAVLSAVVPGAVLQKAVLVLSLALGGLGAGLLVPSARALPRCAAAVAYGWNPYVAERLLMGHWTLLVAHAALPWVLRAGLQARRGVPGAVPRLLLAVAAASITVTGGLLALAVAACSLGRSRRAVPALTGAVLLQLPWLVPAVLSPAAPTDAGTGVEVFAARAESWAGPLGALAGLGGVWNALAVPDSRTSAVAPVLSALLLAVAAAGLPLLLRRWGRADAGRLLLCGAGALVVAALGSLPLLADALAALVDAVPVTGVLRDGHKWLPPWALLLAVCAGLGVERIAARAGTGLAVVAALVPVAAVPDLAWGVGGRLGTAEWPADWSEVRSALDAAPGEADVVSLPFQSYRAFDWNQRRPSLDPAPRWFDRDVVVEDRLLVGDTVVEGEDPRAAQVRAALQEGRPLGPLGIGWALVARTTPGPVPSTALEGAELVVDGRHLQLWRLPDVAEVADRTPPLAPVLLGDAAALAVLVGAAVAAAVRRERRRPGPPIP